VIGDDALDVGVTRLSNDDFRERLRPRFVCPAPEAPPQRVAEADEFDLNAAMAEDEATDRAIAREILRSIGVFTEPEWHPLGPSRAELAFERLRASDISSRKLGELADNLRLLIVVINEKRRAEDPAALPLDLALLVRQREAQLAHEQSARHAALVPLVARPVAKLVPKPARVRSPHIRSRGPTRRPGCSSRRRTATSRARPDEPGGDDPPEASGRAGQHDVEVLVRAGEA
jgi:hypothetical protein